MADHDNSGIRTGDIAGTGIAVGHGASARVGRGSDADVLAQVDQLVSRLLASASSLPPDQAATVAGAAVTVKEEMRAARPDAGKVRQALTRLGDAAGAVAGVIELARQLAELVTPLLR
jgi:hypothetical protein